MVWTTELVRDFKYIITANQIYVHKCLHREVRKNATHVCLSIIGGLNPSPSPPQKKNQKEKQTQKTPSLTRQHSVDTAAP